MRPDPVPLNRRDIHLRLGQLYRYARILRRLLRVLDDAERLRLPITTADQLTADQLTTTEGRRHG